MKRWNCWKKGMFCFCMLGIEMILYFGTSSLITYVKEEKTKRIQVKYEFQTETEFLRTIDCAPIFDTFPNSSFEIKFEICAKKPGKVLVYQQNGSNSRYSFEQEINVTEFFEEIHLVVEPVLIDEAIENSYLSFYGEYDSGVIPTVRNLSVRLIE